MHAFTCSKLSTPASNQKWEAEVGIRAALLNFKVWLKRKTETAIWMIQVQNLRSPPNLEKKEWGFLEGRGGRERVCKEAKEIKFNSTGLFSSYCLCSHLGMLSVTTRLSQLRFKGTVTTNKLKFVLLENDVQQ